MAKHSVLMNLGKVSASIFAFLFITSFISVSAQDCTSYLGNPLGGAGEQCCETTNVDWTCLGTSDADVAANCKCDSGFECRYDSYGANPDSRYECFTLACGDADGAACCADETCTDPNLACVRPADGVSQWTCRTCGNLNQPCCDDINTPCKNISLTCDSNKICTDPTVPPPPITCGGTQQPCCFIEGGQPVGQCTPGELANTPGSCTCNNTLDSCVQDQNGTPICDSNACGTSGYRCCTQADGKPPCEGDMICKSDFCTAPGDINPFDQIGYTGPIISDIGGLLAPVFRILFYTGVFVGILGIIYSGYLLIASEGDPGRVKEGKDQFTAAILGTLFVLLSVFILRVIINNILGINSGL